MRGKRAPPRMQSWEVKLGARLMLNFFLPKKKTHGCWTKNRGILPPKWMGKIMENPIKMDDLGVPLFLETPTYWDSICQKVGDIKSTCSLILLSPQNSRNSMYRWLWGSFSKNYHQILKLKLFAFIHAKFLSSQNDTFPGNEEVQDSHPNGKWTEKNIDQLKSTVKR